ncbi:MAG: DUF541 domain-containing protein [Cyanobacteria bacterium K_DeepCast_35m_m2_023]|nr:DUF541 domain-containing protein [Cyanobacteria bacterium K_DeepCast_35m_m2_023]
MVRLSLALAPLPLLIALPAPSPAAQVQLQLRCEGTVLEARGEATIKRRIDKLAFSLALEAVAPSSKAALGVLQERLGVVRTRLNALAVQDLRVTSPSVWNRYVSAGKPAEFEASSRVSGQLAPSQLQSLISQVGGLPGVRLEPVDPQADKTSDGAANRQLAQAAYGDALRQAQDLAAAVGLSSLRPLQLQLNGGVRVGPMVESMAMMRRTESRFDPRELPEPSDRLNLEVTFCATP